MEADGLTLRLVHGRLTAALDGGGAYLGVRARRELREDLAALVLLLNERTTVALTSCMVLGGALHEAAKALDARGAHADAAAARCAAADQAASVALRERLRAAEDEIACLRASLGEARTHADAARLDAASSAGRAQEAAELLQAERDARDAADAEGERS